MARIYIDMDEVMADSSGKLASMYQQEFGIDLTDALLKTEGKVYDLALSGLRTYVRDYLHRPDFFADLAVLPDAQRVVERLNEHHEVLICSAAVEFPLSMVDKLNWLKQYFPFLSYKQVVFCGRKKNFLIGDFIIDDHIDNVDGFQGTGLLFTASHNRSETRFERVNNWLEVEQYFFAKE
jgi:5'-nucleotidase